MDVDEKDRHIETSVACQTDETSEQLIAMEELQQLGQECQHTVGDHSEI